jgi:hypothetical protein
MIAMFTRTLSNLDCGAEMLEIGIVHNEALSNPLFGIVLVPTIVLYGNVGIAHTLIVKVQNNVR